MSRTLLILMCICLLPIVFYFLQLCFFQKLSNITNKQRELEKKTQQYNDLIHYKQIKIIYNNELKQYYEEARKLFNNLMKNKCLSHNHILYLRKLLEEELGEYIHDYDDYSTKKNGKIQKGFTNDCHRIYTYMKSYHISENGWKQILDFLHEWDTKEDCV